MSRKNLPLMSSIKELRNNEFMHLYLQVMELVKKYVAITKNEYLQRVCEKMQNEVKQVKKLDVELKATPVIVEKRDEVHQKIKDNIKYLKGMVGSYQLWYLQSHRTHAAYISGKLGGWFNMKRVSSIRATLYTIKTIREIIENDTTLANALLELNLMDGVEVLYKQGEEFEQLDVQKNMGRVTVPVINKSAIRKEATSMLKLLFDAIRLNYALTEEGVWMEMAEGVRKLVNSEE